MIDDVKQDKIYSILGEYEHLRGKKNCNRKDLLIALTCSHIKQAHESEFFISFSDVY